ncbi:MAG: SRPBCC family protein [Gammaproteobacteria bacterium]|nr:SRPBCC family protein [Gammaproteobacteria bacterium]
MSGQTAPEINQPAQTVPTDWIDWQLLEAGEILMQTDKAGRGTVKIDLAIMIDADREAIWDVLTACEISPEYVPHVVGCRMLDSIDEGRSELFIQTVKPAFFVPKFEHVFRLDYLPPYRINVRRVSGPIEIMDGYWHLLPRPDGRFALLHAMTLNPGFPVPRLFVRNTLKRDLPIVLNEIRERSEAAASR